MYGIHSFEAFILASIMLNLIPGPDTFYILGPSLAQGRAVGIASAPLPFTVNCKKGPAFCADSIN